MNRMMAIVNFCGILLLCGLSTFQWNSDRRLQLARIDLENDLHAAAGQLVENNRTIRSQAADLDEFRARVDTLSEA